MSTEKIEAILEEADKGFNSPIDFEGVEAVAKEQAKISVKECRGEVIEWVETHWFEIDNKSQGIWLPEWIKEVRGE